jgi:hypothetical protein
VVEVLIEEMFGSDRIRPKDYRRAEVIDAGPKNTTNEDTLPSERRSALKKRLTEPTLLEMSGYPTLIGTYWSLGHVCGANGVYST